MDIILICIYLFTIFISTCIRSLAAAAPQDRAAWEQNLSEIVRMMGATRLEEQRCSLGTLQTTEVRRQNISN